MNPSLRSHTRGASKQRRLLHSMAIEDGQLLPGAPLGMGDHETPFMNLAFSMAIFARNASLDPWFVAESAFCGADG